MARLNILGVRGPDEDKEASASKDGSTRGLKRKRGELSQDPKAQARRDAYRDKVKEEANKERRRICVGVDMGTTFSGIAFVSNANLEKPPVVIQGWGNGVAAFQDKVPSVIGYAQDNSWSEDRWGHSIKPGESSFTWFKLRLDEATDPAAYDDPVLRQFISNGLVRLPEGKTATDVATDYLRFLYNHVLESLRGILGPGLVVTPLVFCLTVPATWSHYARAETRKAAVAAGFGTRYGDELILADEAMTGVLDCLHGTIHDYDSAAQPFQQGSTILNCDLGGGTLDCISYKLVSLEPLRIEEAAVGAGAKAGATAIDRGFYVFLEKTFGISFTDVSLKARAAGSRMMAEFETLKQEFEGAHSKTQPTDLTVPLRLKKPDMDDPEVKRRYDSDEGLITFTPEEMESWFAPILDAGFQLIRDQVAAVKAARMPKVQSVVLCGGLAANRYIKYRFKDFVEKELGKDILCLAPERAWSAICRGASIYARQRNVVVYRRARDNLGYPVHVPFDEDVHDEEDRIELDSGSRAQNQMHWAIRRGQKIYPSTKEEISLYAECDNVSFKKKLLVQQELFSNSDDVAPQRLDESCNPLGTLTMELSGAARAERSRLRKNGAMSIPGSMKIDVKVQVKPGSDKGMMQFKAVTGVRKVAGEVQVEYHTDTTAGKKLKKCK